MLATTRLAPLRLAAYTPFSKPLVHRSILPHRPTLSSTLLSSSSPTTSFLKRFFFGSGASPEDTMAAKQKAQSIIDEHPVAMFSKTYCPYCRSAKSLLSSVGAKPYIIELDEVDDGNEIQAALKELTGQRTVPNIFIGKEHIGGNSELQNKFKQLPTLLKEAGAV